MAESARKITMAYFIFCHKNFGVTNPNRVRKYTTKGNSNTNPNAIINRPIKSTYLVNDQEF